MSWMDRADCVGHDPELFFPHQGAAGEPDRAAARAVCSGCPVKDPCLIAALQGPSWISGVWGGTTWQDRRLIRAEVARARARARGSR